MSEWVHLLEYTSEKLSWLFHVDTQSSTLTLSCRQIYIVTVSIYFWESGNEWLVEWMYVGAGLSLSNYRRAWELVWDLVLGVCDQGSLSFESPLCRSFKQAVRCSSAALYTMSPLLFTREVTKHEWVMSEWVDISEYTSEKYSWEFHVETSRSTFLRWGVWHPW